jgi:aminocarboxymuconate-semialdehyde decarboxylase
MEELCKKRTGYPRAEHNGKNGYIYWFREGKAKFNLGAEWFDLDKQFAHMDATGRDFDMICSTGPFSVHFCEVPAAEGRDACQMWNEEMAGAHAQNPDRLWATAVVPLQDTNLAIDTLNHAVEKLGLIGVNIPGSVGRTDNIDAQRLEPFYDRVEELGIPLFLHPTDAAFIEILDTEDGALYNSLGRVIDVSVSAYRLVLSGVMERHPNMKVFMSHTGGALPYQAGRMDKNSRAAKLPEPPSTYIKRMYTDTVSPHSLGIRFAIDYYGIDHIMYGDDYPCWNPEASLEVFEAVQLSEAERAKIFSENARRFFNLKVPAQRASPAIAAV